MEKYVHLAEDPTNDEHVSSRDQSANIIPDVENVTNEAESPSPKHRRHRHRRHDSTRRIEVHPIESGPVVTSDLSAALHDLQKAVQENTAHMRALFHQRRGPQAAVSVPDLPQPHRNNSRREKMTVEMLVSFLHIIDVHTKQGYFHAELYIEAKWAEPTLNGYSQQDLDAMDFTDVWQPDLVLVNAVGEMDDVKKWYTAKESTPMWPPAMYLHMRVRGQFKEGLELHNFPVDKQELTVTVSCERPASELTLIPNTSEVASAVLETFSDSQEFRLWEQVEVRQQLADPQAVDKYHKSSKISYTCTVSRRPSYYLINGILLQFLIGMLTFFVFLQPPSNFTTRASLAATLLLTSVAFQFTVLGDLPNVPYITYLGFYSLTCRIIQVGVIVETGIVYYVGLSNTPTADQVDKVAGGILVGIFVLFNVIYVIILGLKYMRMYRYLSEKESEFKHKKACQICIVRQ